ncbi:enoyl-CoA hydratase [Streptomonospora alba]|uniref:Enoyl-CoA hydratase domain-containing protein 3, mitochondrial n=1 Tax=Streptomonospora alba TaxID=183763 RepID=A0A0C2JLZ1_9ACTN|nr:enoyl-CoA hydratase-related protein [Streptomonospora alba]KIH99975.1 enoyl-CoA hydratase [Streptomonospora alba]
MSDEPVLVERDGAVVTITMNRPRRRNALSLEQMRRLIEAFEQVAASDATGVVLAGSGPVFSAGHDFADVAEADLDGARELLRTCVRLMETIQSVPQVVLARVHGLATAAGCQLVADCDLAVAGHSAGFAAPGGKGGWFCHTPMVAVSRCIGRKRAMEMALTGDTFDADSAAEWGLVNRAVPDAELESASLDLLERATRGAPRSTALGKQTLYAQFDRPERDAYSHALEVMAASSQTPEAREGIAAFLEKRTPNWREA